MAASDPAWRQGFSLFHSRRNVIFSETLAVCRFLPTSVPPMLSRSMRVPIVSRSLRPRGCRMVSVRSRRRTGMRGGRSPRWRIPAIGGIA